MRRFEVSHRDYDLPSGGRRVALIGPAETLSWPSLCPNCGEMASGRINIQKVFRRKTRRTPWRYSVTAIEVPFCGGCVARHQTLVEPPRAFDGWLAVFKSPLLIPLVGSCVMGALIFTLAGLAQPLYEPDPVPVHPLNPKLAFGVALIDTLAPASNQPDGGVVVPLAAACMVS